MRRVLDMAVVVRLPCGEPPDEAKVAIKTSAKLPGVRVLRVG